jgi:hypothetical protein
MLRHSDFSTLYFLRQDFPGASANRLVPKQTSAQKYPELEATFTKPRQMANEKN